MVRRRSAGRLLARALRDHAQSQRDVERDLDIARGLVSRWISGERVPSIEQALYLREHLGVPIEAWVGEPARTGTGG